MSNASHQEKSRDNVASNNDEEIQAPKLQVYCATVARSDLRMGVHEPVAVTLVRESSLDEYGRRNFYHPAVLLLDRICREKPRIS